MLYVNVSISVSVPSPSRFVRRALAGEKVHVILESNPELDVVTFTSCD